MGRHAGELLDYGGGFVCSFSGCREIPSLSPLTSLDYIIFSLGKAGAGEMLFLQLGKAFKQSLFPGE